MKRLQVDTLTIQAAKAGSLRYKTNKKDLLKALKLNAADFCIRLVQQVLQKKSSKRLEEHYTSVKYMELQKCSP
jgi:hypothetical protein